jgi:hypothetical protein
VLYYIFSFFGDLFGPLTSYESGFSPDPVRIRIRYILRFWRSYSDDILAGEGQQGGEPTSRLTASKQQQVSGLREQLAATNMTVAAHHQETAKLRRETNKLKEDLVFENQEVARLKEASKTQEDLARELSKKLAGQMKDDLARQMKQDMANQIKEEVSRQMREELANQIREQVTCQMREELANQIREQVVNQMREELASQIKEQLGRQMRKEEHASEPGGESKLKGEIAQLRREGELHRSLILEMTDHWSEFSSQDAKEKLELKGTHWPSLLMLN